MKRITSFNTFRFSFSRLILSLLFTSPLLLVAQIYTGNMNLNDQAAVDVFAYTEITGSLSISGADINNLDGLSSLTSVNGSLFINYNPALTNLDGLSSLTTVGKTLEIASNPLITDLDGLSSLTSLSEDQSPIPGIGSSLFIDGNTSLTNLNGLSGISSVNEFSNVWISRNTSLTEFCGLYTIASSGEFDIFLVGNNLVNPNEQQITADGPCIVDPGQMIDDILASGALNQGQANLLNNQVNNCQLNVFNNIVSAWVNAGFLSQGQVNVLIASAAANCATPSKIANQESFILGQNYPNPSGTNTVIPFTLTTSGTVSIQLYDASGKMVKNLINQYLTEGKHEVKVNLQSLPVGTYFYKLEAGKQTEMMPMVVE